MSDHLLADAKCNELELAQVIKSRFVERALGKRSSKLKSHQCKGGKECVLSDKYDKL